MQVLHLVNNGSSGFSCCHVVAWLFWVVAGVAFLLQVVFTLAVIFNEKLIHFKAVGSLFLEQMQVSVSHSLTLYLWRQSPGPHIYIMQIHSLPAGGAFRV